MDYSSTVPMAAAREDRSSLIPMRPLTTVPQINVCWITSEVIGKGQGAGADPGRGDVNTTTSWGSRTFTVMAALATMGREARRKRSTESVTTHRAVGKDRGGRRQTFTDSPIRKMLRPYGLRCLRAGRPSDDPAPWIASGDDHVGALSL
jgi:hypothetical protein